MPIITFSCEKNYRDYLINSLKISILSKNKNITFLDISTQISPFEIVEAALILRNTFRTLPEGSIHFIFVQNIIDIKHPPLIFRYANHYFITADNGFISLFLRDDKPQEVVRLNSDIFLSPYSEISYYPDVVTKILHGKSLKEIGLPENKYLEYRFPKPFFDKKNIKGIILYFDSYQNIISNIFKSDFERYKSYNHFILSIQYTTLTIKKINHYYHEVLSGEVFALFNNFNLLEIGQYNGKIKETYHLKKQLRISIEFYD